MYDILTCIGLPQFFGAVIVTKGTGLFAKV